MATLYDDGSRYLASSISSMSTSRQQASQIAKAYRQAAQLFLTRRLPEALSTIEPIITPPPVDEADGTNGDLVGHAPVATASRGTRIKVWSFYLTFLNAVIELGAEEGKHAFGSTRWKQLVSKCRDGSIWDDVVRDGYAGVEGDVDADVVINLATLLLTHAPSQRLNQQKLETYLSATANPTFDISSHMASPSYLEKRPGHQRQHTGTDTPRDLEKRIKLLELYTLHVLPRNEEWDYAREFITMSEVLDDERKEAFLLALHSLKEEKEDTEAREEKLRQQQQEQMEERRRETEAKRLEQSRAEDERRKREEENRRQPRGSDDRLRKSMPTPQPTPSQSSRTSRTPAKKSITPPPGLYLRASTMFANLQAMIANTAHQMTANPMAFFRTLLFLLAFGLAFGKRDLRERILRILRNAWEKIRRTVGMGVKVSYI
ncbi:peroxin 26 [Pyrenophora seminiperda CCB06]|uniref:Peroxin 26 n=1 Tax=Pyrenophora seminiperda CCB06 TaxID=1302712 RepID=A0A3M7M0A7_9PLEO|nr:peroxin 26 [Pyrenophora seminiperda CCB06]